MGIEIQRVLRGPKRKLGAIAGEKERERGREPGARGATREKKKMGGLEDRWYGKDGPQKW